MDSIEVNLMAFTLAIAIICSFDDGLDINALWTALAIASKINLANRFHPFEVDLFD